MALRDIECKFRTNKRGKRVVFGQSAVITAGQSVKVRDNGTVTLVRITHRSKPFLVDGTLMAYGYID